MCTSPLIRYRYKMDMRNNVKSAIIPYTDSFVIKSQKELEELFNSFSSFLSYCDKYLEYYIIPCRHCTECLVKYSRDWSIRCYHESLTCGCACFITLTVDSAKAHLFIDDIKKSYKKGSNSYCKKCINGHRYFNYPIDYSLNKGFILDWLKRFRDNLYKEKGISIRYFGCGEYGETTERPHYHIIIFGYDFPDKTLFKKSPKGVDMYLSEELSKYWKYGIHTIQSCNYEACMYTAKYCTKKLKFLDSQAEYEHYYGRQPEFLFMSKGSCQVNRCEHIEEIINFCKQKKDFTSLKNLQNPYCKDCNKKRGGIGFEWLLTYYDEVFKLGYIIIDGIKYSIPKYYLDILKLTFPEEYAKYKLRCYDKRDEDLQKRPLEHSTGRLDVKSKVNKSKLRINERDVF